MDKILSIIVPTYNMEKYLDKCLSSLIVSDEQMSKIEVLIINDGSKDNSSDIAHIYEQRYPDTFRVIDKTNAHYGSCVNRGLTEAVGKYVKVLDADDWFDTGNFERYIDFLAENDCDLIFSESCTLVEDSTVQSVWRFSMKPFVEYDINDLLSFFDGGLVHQILTYRRSLLLGIEYKQTEGISYTDLEWVYKPMAFVSSFMYYPNVIYMYLRAREGQSVSPETYCRDVWMEQNVILKLIGLYERQKNDVSEANLKVIRLIVFSNIKRIYFHYLLDYPKSLSNDGLVGFDNAILSASPECYYGVADACAVRKTMTIHYISEWRKRKTRLTLKFKYLDFGIMIGNVLRHVKKMCSK